MYTERQILNSKTPMQYIDRCLNSILTIGQKGIVTRKWMAKTNYSMTDILYAKNRHPHWKQQKNANFRERHEIRVDAHDYTSVYGDRRERFGGGWTEAETIKFFKMDIKNKDGTYKYHDWELAFVFHCTIPAIWGLRRKRSLIRKIKGKENIKTTKEVIQLMCRGEKYLRKVLQEG